MMPYRAALPLSAWLIALLLIAPSSTAAQERPPVQPSRNWSGYVASNAYYTGVSALIQTPIASAQQIAGVAAVASWVGIGGESSDDLIQAGVQVDTNGPVARYSAWYETLPQSSRTVALEIGPGDWVHVDIHELEFNLWQITMVNGQHVFQLEIPYESTHSSAEWIVEAPSVLRGLVPLASVTGANFANMKATANGGPARPVELFPQVSVLVGSLGQVRATPSTLGLDGASFGVAATQ
jgi:Peptidase A4 family